MGGTRAVSKCQVEHDARRQLVQRLLRFGSLTARGLASDTGRPVSEVGHHLRVLSCAGAVASLGESRFKGDEVAYVLSLDGLPRWAYEGLLGRYSAAIFLEVMGAIPKGGRPDVADVAEHTGLSEEETSRYLLFLNALGLVGLAAVTPCERRRVRRALRRHRDFIHWVRYFRFLRSGEPGWEIER